MGEFIFMGIVAFLLFGVILLNKLLDTSAIKKKDATIEEQRREIQSLATDKANAEKASNTAQTASQLMGSLAQSLVSNAMGASSLKEQAKQVESEQDAIELMRRQVEAQK